MILQFINIPTLMLFLAVGCLTFGFVALVAASNSRVIRCWALGYIVVGVAVFLLALRGIAPDYLSVQGANIAAFTGTGLMLMALYRYREPDVSPKIVLGWMAVSIISFLLITNPPISADFWQRVQLVSFLFCINQILAVSTVYRFQRPKTRLQRVLMGSQLVLASVFAARFVWVTAELPEMLHLPVEVNTVFYFLAVMTAIVQGPLFLSLIKEDADRAVLQAREELARQEASRVAEQRLQEMRLRTEKAETIQNFSKGVVHDVNNIVGTLDLGHRQLSHELQAGHAARPELLSLMGNALTHARVTISGLVALSADNPPELATISVDAMIDEVKAILGFRLNDDDQVTFNAASGLFVRTNRALAINALLNLIQNACEASAGKDAVTITVSDRNTEPSGDWRTGHRLDGKRVDFAIHNTGVDINANNVQQIFEPGYTAKAAKSGHGYGLLMVRNTVERTGGALVVESSPQRGTTFHYCMPMGEKAQ